MILSPEQLDALTEIVNIGFSRAAASLSAIVGRRVALAPPTIQFYKLEEFSQHLPLSLNGEVTTIHQIFQGAISGNALLLLDTRSAAQLVNLLNGGDGLVQGLTSADRESLIELGNIVFNAYLGAFGNLLKVHIAFTVPHLRSDDVQSMLRSLTIENAKLDFIMAISTQFQLSNGSVSGYIVLMMGGDALEVMTRSVDQLRPTA